MSKKKSNQIKSTTNKRRTSPAHSLFFLLLFKREKFLGCCCCCCCCWNNGHITWPRPFFSFFFIPILLSDCLGWFDSFSSDCLFVPQRHRPLHRPVSAWFHPSWWWTDADDWNDDAKPIGCENHRPRLMVDGFPATAHSNGIIKSNLIIIGPIRFGVVNRFGSTSWLGVVSVGLGTRRLLSVGVVSFLIFVGFYDRFTFRFQLNFNCAPIELMAEARFARLGLVNQLNWHVTSSLWSSPSISDTRRR